jgi:hypothetical protein
MLSTMLYRYLGHLVVKRRKGNTREREQKLDPKIVLRARSAGPCL